MPASFDSLYRYFDYTVQSRDRLFYQYALLNLGIVQSNLGCHKEAVATMLETISTAKENRDTVCLNHAMYWFFNFSRAHPDLVRELEDNSMLGSGKESLAFLRAKSKETGMWTLWSSALLSEAKLGLASGGSVSASMENMVRSSQLIVERNLRTMIGRQFSLAAALWVRLGMTLMSEMTCEVFLRCHTHTAVNNDQLNITCHLADLLADKGKYEEAFQTLEGLDSNSLRSAKPSRDWRLRRGLVKLRQDLHHNNLEAAELLLSQLLQAGPEVIGPDMVFVIDSLHIQALIRRRDFEAAFTKVDRLITKFQEDNRDVSLRIRLLLTKVHLFDFIGRPEKGFTIAMRAASMAWRARLISLLWRAVGALANILNSLGEFAAAEQLLIAVLPRCLETDQAFTAGTLYNLLADARMGLAGETKRRGGASDRAATMVKVHKALDAAFKCFSAAEDVDKRCEVMAKKATLFRAEGDHVRADGCADTYLGMWEEELGRKV